jgi:ATP cone domain
MTFVVTKADGSSEFFKVEKLRRSLRRAGATPAEINEIVVQITALLHDGMQTQEIYREAFTLLRQHQSPVAARYSLRRALFGLGPTGFPFELFLSRLFETDGYKTKTGIIIEGHCASHEIDVAAYRDDHSFVGEAKFHARPGIKSDLQVAMYSYARLLDLKEAKVCSEAICTITEFWLITNTKFTSAAERYGECMGLKLLSWDLHDRIQRAGIYPITVLTSITQAQAETLIARNIILCRDVLQNPSVLRHLHLTTKKHEAVLQEVTDLCTS